MPADENDDLRVQLAVARYEADRAHELALDVASAGFEIAFLQNTFLLNGGSATAFLAFVSSTFGSARRAVVIWEAGALIAWIIGLVIAATAGILAYKAQKSFLRASRARRVGFFLREFPTAAGLLELLPGDDTAAVALRHGTVQATAKMLWRLAGVAGLTSIGLFVTGIVLAAIALLAWRASV